MPIDLQNAINVYISNRNNSNRNRLVVAYIPEIKKIIRGLDSKKALEINDILHDCTAKFIEILPTLENYNATTGYIAIIITNYVKRKLRSRPVMYVSDEILEHVESEPHNENSIIEAIHASRMIDKINNLDLTEAEREAVAIASGKLKKKKDNKYQRAIKSIRSKLGVRVNSF